MYPKVVSLLALLLFLVLNYNGFYSFYTTTSMKYIISHDYSNDLSQEKECHMSYLLLASASRFPGTLSDWASFWDGPHTGLCMFQHRRALW